MLYLQSGGGGCSGNAVRFGRATVGPSDVASGSLLPVRTEWSVTDASRAGEECPVSSGYTNHKYDSTDSGVPEENLSSIDQCDLTAIRGLLDQDEEESGGAPRTQAL